MKQTSETGTDQEVAGTDRLNRRLFFFKSMAGVAAVTMSAAVVTVATTQTAEAQRCTDRDPYDPAGGGRWCRRRRSVTDSDPYDAAGRGRGGYRRRVCTDRDPYDAAGRGRWCR